MTSKWVTHPRCGLLIQWISWCALTPEEICQRSWMKTVS